ncbi:hypothetical protein KFK14_17575 [Sphingobium phenoxybenzoativorans]|uniref:Uncharacterized protein n=1 Tax=Sphingobium phenoxybenzoativorans TaxID=1592790 RepID=A0A975Q0Z3_9SPHN|nr:hypothetical protein [Sphingobium phenoxybenzoativorans]QUT04827.1 hypothetical protein KFK14_17575 [Sphingobium phenoxybenzoativorans]
MDGKNDIIALRAQAALTKLGLSARAASLAATGQPDTLRFVFSRGVVPSWQKITDLAAVLQLPPAYLAGNSDDPTLDARTRRFLNKIRLEKGLPQIDDSGALIEQRFASGDIAATRRSDVEALIEEAGGTESIPIFEDFGHLNDFVFVDEFGEVVSDQLHSIDLKEAAARARRPSGAEGYGILYGTVLSQAVTSHLTAKPELFIFSIDREPKPGDFALLHIRDAKLTKAMRFMFVRVIAYAIEHIEVERPRDRARLLVPRTIALGAHRMLSMSDLLGLN